MSTPRFAIGIDLGTSNSALAYVDLLAEREHGEPEVIVLEIPQRDLGGAERFLPTLPSVLFIPPGEENRERSEARLEVGLQAKLQTELLPGRVVQSAKSWLAFGMMEQRENGCLPWGSDEIPQEKRWSPVDASAEFLRRLREAWDAQIAQFTPEYRFVNQDITITVPASFDEAATRLTLEAAARAGFPPHVRLLEEPQAAFYRWLSAPDSLSRLQQHATEQGKPRSSRLLVCDVGGGTTDFSLFRIDHADGGPPHIERLAVGEHLLLGGDNIDLALALECEKELVAEGEELTASQRSFLLFQARRVKEELLLEDPNGESREEKVLHIALPGAGRSLFAGSRSAPISRSMLRSILLHGFFPFCAADEVPQAAVTGLREWGLPYVADSGVTRHLAHFLHVHRAADEPVDAVLFAGGTLTPRSLQRRIAEAIKSWTGTAPLELTNPRMDLAVAEGAAYYGFLVLSHRRRIEADYGKTLYVELFREAGEQTATLLCLVPRGVGVGERHRVEGRRFHLLTGRPVRFQLYSSAEREHDAAGVLLPVTTKGVVPLPPLELTLDAEPAGRAIEVELEVLINELGRLELFCVEAGTERRWQLTFNLRKSEGGEAPAQPPQESESAAEALRPEIAEALRAAVLTHFGKKSEAGKERDSVKKLLPRLEQITQSARAEWSPAVLRELWTPLAEGITRRGRSLGHEQTWFSLAGFALRPGYGYPGDEQRMVELWRCFQLGLSFPKEASSVTQWWIMWRRVAGGLRPEWQEALFGKLRAPLREKRGDLPEMARLAASLEWLPAAQRIEIGDILLQRITARTPVAAPHMIWALGRLASRTGAYAGPSHVVPAAAVERWCRTLLELDWRDPTFSELTQLAAEACRIVNDPQRDLDDKLRLQIVERMRSARATAEQLRVVEGYVPFARQDVVRLYGEELPAGLKLLV